MKKFTKFIPIHRPSFEFIEWMGDNGYHKIPSIRQKEWTNDSVKFYTLEEVHDNYIQFKYFS